MKKGLHNNNTESQSGAVWHVQPGRSRVQRKTVADGFRTEYPYAGVVVVSENLSPDEDSSASIAVETIRDVFAEGVAFGVEDALSESFEEASDLIREKKLGGCSAAAIAFSATHIWYALAGNCRIYRIDSDGVRCIVKDRSRASEMNMQPDHPDYIKTIRNMDWWLGAPSEGKPVCGHTRLRRDTTYLAMTSSSWIQFEHISPILNRKGIRRTLNGWLTSLSRDLKLAYRRQGGALAAVSGARVRSGGAISWKSIGIAAASLLLAGYLVFGNPFTCNDQTSLRSDLFSGDTVPEEIVQPIMADSTADDAETATDVSILSMFADSMSSDSSETLLPDISDEIPLPTVFIGESAVPLPADSFLISTNAEPDIQWENFAPGIYSINGDSASEILAQSVSALYPELEVFKLNRIITVRESGVAESARWLSELPADSAASTGVVVETRSSVAGGASWIRNYPVFSNGDRDGRSSEPGGFYGDSLPEVPLLRDPSAYRLIIVR